MKLRRLIEGRYTGLKSCFETKTCFGLMGLTRKGLDFLAKSLIGVE